MSRCGKVGFLFETADGALFCFKTRLGACGIDNSGYLEYVSVKIRNDAVRVLISACRTLVNGISLILARGGNYGIDIFVTRCGKIGFLLESADGAFLRLISRFGACRLDKLGRFEYVSVTIRYDAVLIFAAA